MDKIAIVIGATGLVGHALVEQLADADHIGKVITLTRRPAKHLSSKVDNIVVDFSLLEKHALLFSGDILFSCLGTTRQQAGSIAAQRKVDYEYQLKAAQLAASNGVNHYVLVSSSGGNEKSRNPYLKMKGELEQKVTALPFERITILQPSLLLGTRADARLGETMAAKALPLMCVIPWLRRFRPIKGEQVAAKMVQVSQQTEQGLERFELDDIFIA